MSCSEKVRHSKILLEDGAGKSIMCFNNPNRKPIIRIKVDDCLIKIGRRCDFMLKDHNLREYYIELKGKQISHACSQIEETIKKLSENLIDLKHSFIVSTACPLTTTEIQVFKVMFKKKYNSTLTIKNNFCEHSL